MASGFLVIVQLGVLDQVGKLYINQTSDYQTSASVEVEEQGVYLVSVIPAVDGSGIIGSGVGYREIVMVMDTPTLPDTTGT